MDIRLRTLRKKINGSASGGYNDSVLQGFLFASKPFYWKYKTQYIGTT